MTGANATTVGAALRAAHERLTRAGVAFDEASASAGVLLAEALDVAGPAAVRATPTRPLTEAEAARFEASLRRRIAREPTARIIGAWELWSLRLAVAPGVLVPRPETETLVEVGLAELERLAAASPGRALDVVDVGTGTGAVAIALAVEAERRGIAVQIVATDIEPAPRACAATNVAAHGLGARVRVLEADLLPAGGPFDLIVSNPPYVTEAELSTLEPEVRDHDPRAALLDPDGAEDGLGLTRRLATAAARTLRPGGALAVEVGAGRAAAAIDALTAAGLTEPRAIDDLAGVARVVVASRRLAAS